MKKGYNADQTILEYHETFNGSTPLEIVINAEIY